MARKQKKKDSSPYDDSAGRGTGDYLASKSTSVVSEPAGPRMRVGHEEFQPGPPDSTLVGAILATLFCFWPLGIIGIVWALRVRPRWKRGDEVGARHAAAMAEKFTFAAVGLFVIIFAVSLVAYGVYWFLGPRTKP